MLPFLTFIAPLLSLLKSGVAFLLKNPLILALLVIAALSFALWGEHGKVASVQARLKASQAALSQCAANTKAQNDAVRATAAAGVKATAAAAKALTTARAGRAGVSSQIARNQAIKEGASACAALQALRQANTK